jgi:membrane protein DedA with SNARE-associated domain
LVDPSWIVRALDALERLSGPQAYFALLFALGLCGLGLPMPEDVILLTAGYLAALGKFSVFSAVIAGMVGVLSGDALLFALGRRYGPGVFRWRTVQRMFSDDQILLARSKIQQNGRFICFIARFLPGLRSPIYLCAGAMGITPRVYITQDLLAASISVPFWVVLGWWFGPAVETALRTARNVQGWILAAVVVGVLIHVSIRWWASRKQAHEDQAGG